MNPAIQALLARLDDADPFDYKLSDVREQQWQAATDRLRSARSAISILDRRAGEASVDAVTSLEHLIPLLFSDSTYKSYPESFIDDGRWKDLATWVDLLSTRSGAADLDFSEVTDIDEWLAVLKAAGHNLYVSTGTSGRCSMFQAGDGDRDFELRVFTMVWRWANGVEPDASRAVFALFPSKGSHRMMDSFGRQAHLFGRADSIYYLSDEPLLVSELNATGGLRRSIAEGTASPGVLKAFEEQTARRQEGMAESVERMAEAIVRHASEPALFLGTAAPLYAVLNTATQLGLQGVHPDSAVLSGGGSKGVKLPDDAQAVIDGALRLDPSRFLNLYAMSEITSLFPRCGSGRYHCPPWVIPLVLDDLGERLIKPELGVVHGRLALIDLSVNSRWAGLITGDKVHLELDACECGRSSPALRDDIVRYADLPGGVDKVTCAGTMDDYVRGAIGATR